MNTDKDIRLIWAEEGKYPQVISETVSVRINESRTKPGLKDTEFAKVKEFANADELEVYVKSLLKDTELNPKGVDVDYSLSEGAWPEKTGVDTKLVYAVTYKESADYLGQTCKLTIWMRSSSDNSTVSVEIENGSAAITNSANNEQNPVDGVYTVLGNTEYTFKFTPVSGYAIESATVNGKKVPLTYSKQVASFTMTLTESENYEIVVETVPAKFELEEERIYGFAFGWDTPVNEDIVDAVVAGPENIDMGNVKVEYLARSEGTAQITIPEIVILEGLPPIPASTMDVELGELWLDPTAEIKEVDLEEITDVLVVELFNKVKSGELRPSEIKGYVESYIRSLTLNAHAFGANGDWLYIEWEEGEGYVRVDQISLWRITHGGGTTGGGGGGSAPADGTDVSVDSLVATDFQGGIVLLGEYYGPEMEEDKEFEAGKGVVIAHDIEAYIYLLSRDAEAKVIGYDEEFCTIYLGEDLTAKMPRWLLRLEGDEEYESWTGYAVSNAVVYEEYQMRNEMKTLTVNTEVLVLDKLPDCYVVMVDDEIGYMEFDAVSETEIVNYGGGTGGGTGGGGSGDVWTPPAL